LCNGVIWDFSRESGHTPVSIDKFINDVNWLDIIGLHCLITLAATQYLTLFVCFPTWTWMPDHVAQNSRRLAWSTRQQLLYSISSDRPFKDFWLPTTCHTARQIVSLLSLMNKNISFMKTLNKRCPSIDNCGTPLWMSVQLLRTLLTFIC
jgi:hypothetical protein